MARTSVQKFKTTLLCFGLGCIVIPVCAALGSSTPCIPSGSAVAGDAKSFAAASRRDGCEIVAAMGGSLTYDSSGVRCVQGKDGCDFPSF
jgi:hypothetical protein